MAVSSTFIRRVHTSAMAFMFSSDHGLSSVVNNISFQIFPSNPSKPVATPFSRRQGFRPNHDGYADSQDDYGLTLVVVESERTSVARTIWSVAIVKK